MKWQIAMCVNFVYSNASRISEMPKSEVPFKKWKCKGIQEGLSIQTYLSLTPQRECSLQNFPPRVRVDGMEEKLWVEHSWL